MIPFIDVDLTPTETREALRDVLQGDFDPADDTTRLGVPAGTGQLLAMPSAVDKWAGCKVATVAPDNPAWALARGWARGS